MSKPNTLAENLAEAAAREAIMAKRWLQGDPDWEDGTTPADRVRYHRDLTALLATAANALRKAGRA